MVPITSKLLKSARAQAVTIHSLKNKKIDFMYQKKNHPISCSVCAPYITDTCLSIGKGFMKT